MKHSLLVASLALSCGAVFAQAPAGTAKNPPAESNPTAAGGKAADKAEMKADTKKGDTAKMGAGPGKMDADGDGTVTKKEWDSYHSAMWTKMSKGGKVSTADAEAMLKGGPN